MRLQPITRRNSLLALAAGPLAAGAAAPAQSGTVTVGVVTTDFSDHTNKSLAQELKGQGVRVIQFFFTQKDSNYWKYGQRSDLAGMTAARAKENAAIYGPPGISIQALGVYPTLIHPDPGERKANLAYFDAMMKLGSHMGVNAYLSEMGHYIPPGPATRVAYDWQDDVWKAALGTAKELALVADANGATVLLESIYRSLLSSAKRTRVFLEEVGSPRVRAQLDPANLLEVDDLEEMFQQLGPWIGGIHAKDRKLHVTDGAAAGKGDLDYPKFVTLAADWTIGLSGNPDGFRAIARLGLDGMEISLGTKPVGGRLLLDDPQLLARYAAAAGEHRVAIAGACIDILNQVCLKDNPGAEKWLRDGIRLTAKLGARVLLVPFFGKDCALETAENRDRVADILKEVGPAAEAVSVKLGLENWLSAEDNARLMERCGSSAVGVYYDVGNSTRAGHDAVKEIRWLGARRICQFHLKQQPATNRLSEGSVDLAGVCQAIREIGFTGFANLETRAQAGAVERDIGQDLAYLRGLL